MDGYFLEASDLAVFRSQVSHISKRTHFGRVIPYKTCGKSDGRAIWREYHPPQLLLAWALKSEGNLMIV